MLTAAPKLNELPSNSAGPRRDTSPGDEIGDDGDSISTLNNVESLKQGIIKASRKAPITILLVGETGVGKSSVLELIANVLIGKDIDHYDFDILDHNNEQGGSDNQSQTKEARLYELKSNNGIVVRILDTPGLADARGIQQDELHSKSIATQIKKHVDSITAVLVLANGTVPRVNVGALSTLSAIFPKIPANNTALLLTNVSSPLYRNLSEDTLPDDLNNARQFLFNTPIALRRKYLKLKDDLNMKKGRTGWHALMKADEQNALEILADLFDWLDGLEPQPTTEIVPLYERFQNMTNALALKDRLTARITSMLATGARILSIIGNRMWTRNPIQSLS